MRSAGIISALILSATWCEFALAKANESIVCKSVSHCVDIVERHAPDSFDYQVLNGEFQRFGPKGKAALLNMLASKDETDIRRAQAVLAKGRVLLSPDEQRKVAALWPRGDIALHAKIMQSALSPMMRARAIRTLSHEEAQVRKLSRDIIAATVAQKMDFPLRPDDYGGLAKALIDDPTPSLVELISVYDPAKTKPIFMRLLKSDDGPSLSAAYKKLYSEHPEEAFKALVATLYELKDTQSDEAFALSLMLRERHADRKDGFYMKFAKDLTEDPEMSPIGRLAGFDAIMQSADAPRLSEPSKYYDIIGLALQNHDELPTGYLRNMPRQAGETSDMWLAAYWEHFAPQTGEQKLELIRLVGGFETGVAKDILLEALGDKGDWRITQTAALPLGRMKYKQAESQLTALSDHPIMAVQIAALTALDNFKSASKGGAHYWYNKLSSASAYCSAEPKDFKVETKTLPFFDLDVLAFNAIGDKRHYISTIAPTKTGYLVGFDAGVKGGDLRYYDNASGDSTPLKDALSPRTENITAIVPVTPPPLGQYADAFWIFAEGKAGSDQAKLYRASGSNGNFQIKYQAELPHRVTALSPQKNGEVFMSFYKQGAKPKDVNPPLLLSPNGAIRRACAAAADTAEALP